MYMTVNNESSFSSNFEKVYYHRAPKPKFFFNSIFLVISPSSTRFFFWFMATIKLYVFHQSLYVYTWNNKIMIISCDFLHEGYNYIHCEILLKERRVEPSSSRPPPHHHHHHTIILCECAYISFHFILQGKYI